MTYRQESNVVNKHLVFVRNWQFMFQVESIVKDYILDDAVYNEVAQRLSEHMNMGLDSQQTSKADLKMFPTYVRSLPNGSGILTGFMSGFILFICCRLSLQWTSKENQQAGIFNFVLQCNCVHFVFVERGSFLALDLGGTNFRVLLITLKDSAHVEMKNKIYPISQATMTGPGSQVKYQKTTHPL